VNNQLDNLAIYENLKLFILISVNSRRFSSSRSKNYLSSRNILKLK